MADSQAFPKVFPGNFENLEQPRRKFHESGRNHFPMAKNRLSTGDTARDAKAWPLNCDTRLNL
jgi:hypothetical protein